MSECIGLNHHLVSVVALRALKRADIAASSRLRQFRNGTSRQSQLPYERRDLRGPFTKATSSASPSGSTAGAASASVAAVAAVAAIGTVNYEAGQE